MTLENTIINKDCIEGLKSIPDQCVDCCVTSPPYYGLRDYGHEGQIGLEATPDAYLQKMVEVFREVRRVLKDDGTIWINMGDSYASGRSEFGLKPKDLVGMPWRLAFALQEDGWYLRQDIIWHKPNPMPESVTDRCTKAHEYIFLLSKNRQYYYDYKAIMEDASSNTHARLPKNGQKVPSNWDTKPGSHGAYHREGRNRKQEKPGTGTKNNTSFNDAMAVMPEKANKRSVWTVSTEAVSEAHFATFPQALIAPCIMAGCPEGGIVLDPFMGSGTTAIVSKKLNRRYIGIEINPQYISIANKRIHEHLGLFK